MTRGLSENGAAGTGSSVRGAAISLLAALGIGAAVFAAAGANPLRAYAVMLTGAFGNTFLFSEVLVKATPLTLTGLAVALAARMQLWNIGCEGQLVLGGVAAAGTALYLSPLLPLWAAIPALVAAGMLGGGLWALGPAFLKTRFQVSEIISTLMLNYVAVIFMEHLYFGPWRDPMGMGFPGTAMLPESCWLPRFFGTRIHLGLLLALVGVGLLTAVLRKTVWGFHIDVIGKNAQAARYAGMAVRRHQVLVLVLSGALAGLAGMCEVGGIHLRLQQGLAVGYGYDGIIVAFLARLNPLAVPGVACLLAILIVGGDQLQTVLHLPSSISMVLEGAILMSLPLGQLVNRALSKRGTGNAS
jgi:ABC-type uncharacterized transport system permease subunit